MVARRRPAIFPPLATCSTTRIVLSIALGALCFVALQHACRAGWSVSVRRLAELLAAPMPLLAILAIPIVVPVVLGKGALYEWADPNAVAGDESVLHKAPYLNGAFFVARSLGYFLVWWLLARYLSRSIDATRSLARRPADTADGAAGRPCPAAAGPDRHLRVVRLADVARSAMVEHHLRRLLLLRGDRGVSGRGDPGGIDAAMGRTADRQHNRRALSRPGKTPLCICRLLGLYCILAVPR